MNETQLQILQMVEKDIREYSPSRLGKWNVEYRDGSFFCVNSNQTHNIKVVISDEVTTLMFDRKAD